MIEDEPAEFERTLQLSCDRLRSRVDEQKARAEKAEAACAEMRAALEAAHYLSADWRAKVATALAHSDLERGMVAVPREVVERMCGLLRRSRVGGASRLLADLDALLKKGGG